MDTQAELNRLHRDNDRLRAALALYPDLIRAAEAYGYSSDPDGPEAQAALEWRHGIERRMRAALDGEG